MKQKKWKIGFIILVVLLGIFLAAYLYLRFVRVPDEVLRLEKEASDFFREENLEEAYEKIQKAEFVVILDAVNGGTSGGKRSSYLKEQDLALEICKLVDELNQDEKIAVVLSRTKDFAISTEDRNSFIEKLNPDLLIQIGMSHKVKPELRGTSVYYPVDYYNHRYTNQEFADDMERAVVQKIEGMAAGIFEMEEEDDSVLFHKNMPTILLHCGNMTNELEKDMFEKQAFKELVAEGILDGIREAKRVLEEQ